MRIEELVHQEFNMSIWQDESKLVSGDLVESAIQHGSEQGTGPASGDFPDALVMTLIYATFLLLSLLILHSL